MFPHVPFEMGRICGKILALVATVQLFPVMQRFLGIFFCCQCLHLRRIFFMELAARLEDNWTLENYCHFESACFESESYQIVEMFEFRMSIEMINIDESTWTCCERPKHEVGMKILWSDEKWEQLRARKPLSRLSGFWGQKYEAEKDIDSRWYG